jgi:hypothetical protein
LSCASALFQVYERNERLGLPSFVMPELAVELFLAVRASAQRDVELLFAAPELHGCLLDLVRAGLALRAASRTDPPDMLEALDRMIAVFAVASRLLVADEDAGTAMPAIEPGEASEEGMTAADRRVAIRVPFPPGALPELPSPVQTFLGEAVSRIRTADGVHATAVLRRETDFRPFADLAALPSGRPRALARALLWLDLAAPAAGDVSGNAFVEMLALRLLADRTEDEGAAERWGRVFDRLAFAGRRSVGDSIVPAALEYRRGLDGGTGLPASAAASIAALNDSGLRPPRSSSGFLPGPIDPERTEPWPVAERWTGQAAPPDDERDLLLSALAPGTAGPATTPFPWVLPGPWDAVRRSWTASIRFELRHPRRPAPGGEWTDCFPTDAPPVPGAVAPEAALYASIDGALATLADDLRRLGVLPEREIEMPRDLPEEAAYRIQERIAAARGFVGLLRDVAEASGRGGDRDGLPFTEEQAAGIARIGSWAEQILADAIDADFVAGEDRRRGARAAEGAEGVGGVDLLYVLVPGPEGRFLARGAQRAVYADVAWSPDRPVEDDEWRRQLDAVHPTPRPEWLVPVLLGPVAPPTLDGEGIRRCLGPESGGDLEI